MYGTLELLVYGFFGSLDFWILSVPLENKKTLSVPCCQYPWIFGFLRCLALPGTGGIRRSRGAKKNRVLGVYASRMVFQV
jgi:hypothetical protein